MVMLLQPRDKKKQTKAIKARLSRKLWMMHGRRQECCQRRKQVKMLPPIRKFARRARIGGSSWTRGRSLMNLAMKPKS